MHFRRTRCGQIVCRATRAAERIGDTVKARNKATDDLTATLLKLIPYVGPAGSRARPRYSSLMYVKYTTLLVPCLARDPAGVCDENASESP